MDKPKVQTLQIGETEYEIIDAELRERFDNLNLDNMTNISRIEYEQCEAVASAAALGSQTKAKGNNSIATGSEKTKSGGDDNNPEHLRYTEAIGESSMASGMGSIAFSRASKSLGYRTQTGYPASAMEGTYPSDDAQGNGKGYFHAPDTLTDSEKARVESGSYGQAAVAIGNNTLAAANHSLAGGDKAKALAQSSLSFGSNTETTGDCSIAMGSAAKASAPRAVALGESALALGQGSFAANGLTEAAGNYSAAFGYKNKTTNFAQFVVGHYSDPTNTNALFVVGNGSDVENRKNAFVVDKTGWAKAAGNIFVNDNEIVATRNYVDTQVAQKVAQVVDSAPETLDTLNELAAALNNNKDFAATVATEIGTIKGDIVTANGKIASLEQRADRVEVDIDLISEKIHTIQSSSGDSAKLEAADKTGKSTSVSLKPDSTSIDSDGTITLSAVQNLDLSSSYADINLTAADTLNVASSNEMYLQANTLIDIYTGNGNKKSTIGLEPSHISIATPVTKIYDGNILLVSTENGTGTSNPQWQPTEWNKKNLIIGDNNEIGDGSHSNFIIGDNNSTAAIDSFIVGYNNISNQKARGSMIGQGLILYENDENVKHSNGQQNPGWVNYPRFVVGRYNIPETIDSLAAAQKQKIFIVADGIEDSSRSNAISVQRGGKLNVKSTINSSMGADYAEMFEWSDGNPNAEDRIGHVVTLDGEKIRFAQPGDRILGVVSETAAFLGDSASMQWQQKYVTDAFGRIVEEEIQAYDKESNEYYSIMAPKINPNYNPNTTYIPREERMEWAKVGLVGKLHVRDDGTCFAGCCAKVGSDGILTYSAEETNMQIMKRINDSVVWVFFK